MAHQEFKAPTGAKVVIRPAPWSAAKLLKRAIENRVGISGIPSMNAPVEQIFTTFLRVDSCPEIERTLFECLQYCTRGGQKIVEETFDDVEAREDYYEIAIACAKENLGPLVKGLRSKLSELGIEPTQAGSIPA